MYGAQVGEGGEARNSWANGGPSPEYIPLKEVARRTSLSYDCVYDAARAGRLPAVRVGRVWRVRADDVRRWMDGGRAAPAALPRGELRTLVSRHLPGLSR